MTGSICYTLPHGNDYPLRIIFVQTCQDEHLLTNQQKGSVNCSDFIMAMLNNIKKISAKAEVVSESRPYLEQVRAKAQNIQLDLSDHNLSSGDYRKFIKSEVPKSISSYKQQNTIINEDNLDSKHQVSTPEAFAAQTIFAQLVSKERGDFLSFSKDVDKKCFFISNLEDNKNINTRNISYRNNENLKNKL